MEAGLDSIGAVELRNLVSTRFGVELPATITFDHPSAGALAQYLASMLAPKQAGVPHPRAMALGLTAQQLQARASPTCAHCYLVLSVNTSSSDPQPAPWSCCTAALSRTPDHRRCWHGNHDGDILQGGRRCAPAPAETLVSVRGCPQVLPALLDPTGEVSLTRAQSTRGWKAGEGCRCPRAAGFAACMWGGADLAAPIPLERWDAEHDARALSAEALRSGALRFAALAARVDAFDAGAFRLAPAEAAALDPQQRALLEQAASALQVRHGAITL